MADYYTLYSAEIDKLTDDEDFGQVERRDRVLWLCAEDHGDPESVARFVRSFLKRFRKHDSFSMEYSFTCGKPRLDGFGGNAGKVEALLSLTVPAPTVK